MIIFYTKLCIVKRQAEQITTFLVLQPVMFWHTAELYFSYSIFHYGHLGDDLIIR